MTGSDREREVDRSASVEELLVRGRESYAKRAWADARSLLLAADGLAPLVVEDLEQLAHAASLVNDVELMLKTLERVHNACMEEGQELRAARAGFWLGFRLMPRGERARAQAWLARVQRILDRQGDCVERGYVLLPQTIMKIVAGEIDAAEVMAKQATAIGEHYRDRDLIAFARALHARVYLRRADLEHGLSIFDDVMLEATSQELSPTVTGLIYCNVIAALTQVYAFDRAREWTAALSTWCEAQPQLQTFAGTCLVHRAELMELGGEWSGAFEAARTACDRVTSANDPMLAASALYQQAEIHRLRGQDAAAEAAYTECSKRGREPLPGLALLRLAQGKNEAAANALRRVVAATSDPLQRTRYLPAHVEVMIAAGALDEARASCAELEQTAALYRGEVLDAMAKHARASLALAEGNARTAVEPLRDALQAWQRVGAPYIAARIHALIARACAALGDQETAQLEQRCARETFERLGAVPDLAQLDALGARPSAAPKASHGLSARELQVLRLVAAGKTNKVIAGELFLSEKTVDRHVSNIFSKLDVASRAAATAFAYEHGLL